MADITFAHTTDWNSSSSTENNYTAIGYYKASDDQKNFEGTYDGGGHTISGIRIYRNNNTDSDNYQGLFGRVKSNGAIRNVNLSDTRITGRSTVGGIVGYNMGTVEDCTVAANVCIHQIYGGSIHGGVVGNNLRSVKRCISSAHLTVKNGISTSGYGGIVGRNEDAITDCIATDVVIPDVNARGAIVGVLYDNGTLTRNYYHDCKVASDNVTPSGVGQGTADSKTTSDETGAQPLWAITLPTHASVVRTPATDPLPGTDNAIYDNGADINGVPYAKGLSVVNLSYDPATITEGYDVLLAVKKTSDNTAVTFTDNGDYTYRISMMPTADITVSATEIPIIAYIDADGNPQSHACTPIVEGTTSYQTLGRTEGWYVVNTDVTISGTQGVKFLDQQVNIILCDGTTLTSNATTNDFNGIDANNGSLTIYAQSGGTGRIVATAKDWSAINAKLDLDINGGIISATTEGAIGIDAANTKSGSITIRRGSVTAQATTRGILANNNLTILGGTVSVTATRTDAGSGLSAYYGDVSIFGGNVTANGYNGIEAGIVNPTSITLGYTTVDDRITASSYDCATLTIADGQILSDGTATYSGTLSSEQKTAIAGKTLSAAIPYIDADGTTEYKASKDLTFITTSTQTYGNAANAEGWYCVNSDVNFTNNVYFIDQMVHIILCDGATMSGEIYLNVSYSVIAVNNGSLAIYGQTHGTGTLSLNCTAGGSAIFANSNIDINGGTINASSSKGIGIKANNAITIRRGNITARSSDSYGIRATTITLGCPTTADRIYASSYNGTVTIAEGQTLTDGTNTYSGTLTNEQIAAIAGKTLFVDYTNGHSGDSEADAYMIYNKVQLDALATRVNAGGGNDYYKKFIKLGADITYDGTANNYTAIGTNSNRFRGTFDGDGHTISGININRGNDYQGLFGYVSGGTVKNVTLANSTITANDKVGGIVGYNWAGTVQNCRVESTVTINAYANSVNYHGGIVGCNYEKIIGCISSATVSHNGHSSCSYFGAIAGQNHGTIKNCLALGATVSAYSNRGVIAGNNNGTLANNYYYNCTVSSKTTDIGTGSGIDTSDVSTNDGAVEVSAVLSESETVPTELSGKVAFRREFTGGKASTVIFPFAHEKGTEGTYYTFGGVQYDGTEGKWKATMNEYAGATLAANTPYLFVPAGSEAHAPVLFHGTAGYDAAGTTDVTEWSFKGVYAAKTWTAGDVGNDYGFAATSGKAVDGVTDVEAGDFVKLAAGAWIRPMRSYLTYTGGGDPWAAPSHHAASNTELPGRISVILVSANGSTTEIAEMRNEELEMRNGNEEMKNGWYTLDGRKLQGKPTTKGLYIYKGKKVIK